MKIERIPEKYYKLPDGSEFYKMNESGEQNISITSVGGSGVIIYDTKISRIAVNNKFDELELLESTKEEFEKKYFEVKSGSKNENI